MIKPSTYLDLAATYNVELATLKAVAAIACIKDNDHFISVIKSIDEHKLMYPLRQQNWAEFAEGYFGATFRENNSDIRMANAYNAFRKISFVNSYK